MEDRLKKIIIALSDAGCGQDTIEQAERLMKADRIDDLIRHLRLCRCKLMDDKHRTQRRVDCIDYLIRQTKKSLAAKI